MKFKFAMTTLAAVATLGLGMQQASATTFFADGFSYPNGDLTIYDGTGDNVSGGLWQPHSGTGFTPSIEVLNGSAILQNSGSEDANRLAGADNGGTDAWYYAAKFTVTDNNLSDPLVNEDYFIHLRNTVGGTFEYPARTFIANPSLTAGKFAIGLSATGGTLAVKTDDIDYGVEHSIVVKFDPTTGTASLWLNAASEADPFITTSDPGVVGALGTADSLALRMDAFSPFVNGSDNTIAVNGVALATTWDEAFDGSMVPEPASLALLGLGGLAMFRRR